MEGLIIKGIGGFYYVKTEIGLLEAKGRGNLKVEGEKLYVGDMVQIEVIDQVHKKAVIDSILPRKNRFIRPPITNVDTFIVTMATVRPKPNFTLIDKFIIMAEMNNVEVILVINKSDLISEAKIDSMRAIYEKEYRIIPVSAKTGRGIDDLKTYISGKKVAFAGPSGVGKSSLLNALHPEAKMETGDISKKTNRGKHTTRHVEIFQVEGGGFVYDTPGFSSFEIMEAEEDKLQFYYPEIEKFRGNCKYDNCRHIKEPDCYVREAVKRGKIHNQRYESYLNNMEEIKRKKKY